MKAFIIKNDRGTTLIEAMTVVLIISFALAGLFSTFTYGRANVERTGIRRTAVELVQGKMEHWQNRRRQTNEGRAVDPAEKELEPEETMLDENKNLKAKIWSEVSGVQKDGELSYQEMKVTLTYDEGIFKDSLVLRTKMYLR